MPARFCPSCSEPRPLAAVRCPWCLHDYEQPYQPGLPFLDRHAEQRRETPDPSN